MPCDLGDNAQKSIRWTIFGFSIISFVFATVSIAHCSFLIIESFGTTRYGLYSAEATEDRCIAYSKDSKDAFEGVVKGARAFGAMAALFTGIAMVLVVSIQLCLRVALKPAWMAVRILLIASFISQVCTFMFFGVDGCSESGVECKLGAAGIVATLNVLILVALIALSWLVGTPPNPVFLVQRYEQAPGGPPPSRVKAEPVVAMEAGESQPPQEYQPEEEEMVKITYEDGPDGQRVVTKEVTHADGSKTITTTVEELDVDVQEEWRQQDYDEESRDRPGAWSRPAASQQPRGYDEPPDNPGDWSRPASRSQQQARSDEQVKNSIKYQGRYGER